MDRFLKYIIYFILGIISYYLLFNKDLVEGACVKKSDDALLGLGGTVLLDQCSSRTCGQTEDSDGNCTGDAMNLSCCVDGRESTNNALNLLTNIDYEKEGCKNYHCKNRNIYDNFTRKVNPKNYLYDTCKNTNDKTIFYDSYLCTHEICCDNEICGEQGLTDNICQSENDSYLLFNKQCDINLTCLNTNHCCSTDVNDKVKELFNSIIEFRNHHQKANEKNDDYPTEENDISGLDIRNFIYYSLLDFDTINENSNILKNYNNRESLNYTDFDNIYIWLNNFIKYEGQKYTLINDYVSKIILKDHKTYIAQVSVDQSPDADAVPIDIDIIKENRIMNTLGLISSERGDTKLISEDDIKKLLILLDYRDENIKLKPLDFFYHSYYNQNQISGINLAMFNSLL
mgnify:CR=1 FL=1